jgi:hypothetical protein
LKFYFYSTYYKDAQFYFAYSSKKKNSVQTKVKEREPASSAEVVKHVTAGPRDLSAFDLLAEKILSVYKTEKHEITLKHTHAEESYLFTMLQKKIVVIKQVHGGVMSPGIE